MDYKIALAGNPNCGKTTLFNNLTGSNQYVGNWPGVTVDRKEGRLKGHKNIIIQDLPGIYSLSPYSPEEIVSREYLVNEKPDVIINIVDATNIERNLYLTTQLLELGTPIVLAFNMMDLVKKNGDKIDINRLGKELGTPIFPISALKGEGGEDLILKVIELVNDKVKQEHPHVFTGSVEHALAHIEESIQDKVDKENLRWFAVKIFENDEKVINSLGLDADLLAHIREHVEDCEKENDDEARSIITNQRYMYIESIVAKSVVKNKDSISSESFSDKVDKVVTNRILALPIFALVMFLVYYITIGTLGTFLTDWTNDTFFGEWIIPNLQGFLEGINVAPALVGLVSEGIVGGVGAVLGFVPQMLVLFFLLSILEDIGYMSRVAFILDRIFRKFGLSGKSFIPMLVSSGCGVPGVMACRTIENERDRKMTVMTTCFVPCSAKMPIIALIAGAIFGGSPWIAVSAYFVGVGAIVISGIILKKTKLFYGDVAPFVMELPKYHLPLVKNILRTTWDRGWSFIKRAGTIILASSIILWFLQAFGFTATGFGMVEDNDFSLLSYIGRGVAWLFYPLGFGFWQATVATFTGLIAKENVVGTFGVLYHFAEVSEDGIEIWENLAVDFNGLQAYSFMIFNLLCAPCFAAIGAIRREMGNPKWTWIAVGYMTVFSYITSFLVYHFGLLFTGVFSIWSIIAVVLVVFIIYLLFRKGYKAQEV